MTIKIKVDDFKLNIKEVTNSAIGNVSVTFIKTLLKIFEPLLKGIINLVMGRGIDCSWLLKILGFDFITLEKTLL